jgi:hypothetical protein
MNPSGERVAELASSSRKPAAASRVNICRCNSDVNVNVHICVYVNEGQWLAIT